MGRTIHRSGVPGPSKMLWRAVALASAAAIVLFVTGATAAARSGDDVKTSAIKVAFVYNFAKFASWPPGRFRQASDAVRFCIQRGDLHPDAVRPLEDKQIGERPIRTAMVGPQDPVGACHVLFLSATPSAAALAKTLEIARQDGILIVSDMPDFALLGGHIGLLEDRGRLRFQVNLSSVTDADLKLSSQLLQLAEIVGPSRN